MPPQNQSAASASDWQAQAQASEDNARAFMSLDTDGQTRALKNLSPEAKQQLLLTIRSLKSFDELKPASQKEDEGILKGVIDRAKDTITGMRDLFVPRGESGGEHDVGKQILSTYQEGGRQAKEQFQRKQYGRAAVTGLSLLDPFATGSVVSLNQMQDEGRHREALGAAAFDILTLWGGKKIGGAPSEATRINKLTGAIGETGETVKNLERTLPELDASAKVVGKPQTIGDFSKLVRTSLDRLQGEFDQAFQPIKGRRAYTPAIKNHIDRVLRENPNLMKTPEGREQVAALRRVQRTYDKPWTLEDMNLERSRLRKEIRSLYDAKPTDAAAKMKLDAELKAKKIVADSFSEMVNDHLSHATGKPFGYWDILRQKQEALLDLNDHLDSQVERLRDKQAAQAGRTFGEKVKPHAYASAGGPRVHVPFGEAIPGEGATDLASRKVKQAYGPTKGARAGRAAILSLPLSHLTTAGDEAKKSRLQPPPTSPF